MEKFDIYGGYPWIHEEDVLDLNKNAVPDPHPVVVIGNSVVCVVKVTSKLHENYYEIRDWQIAGLSKPSFIAFNRKVLADTSLLTDNNYIGHLSDYDIQRIKSLHLDESLNEDRSNDVEQLIRSIEATIVYKGKVDNFDNIKNDVEEAIYSKYSDNENINLGKINVEVVQGNDFTYYDEQADEQVVALFISSDDTAYKDILEAEDEVTDEKYIEKVDVEDDFTELLKSLPNVIDGEVIYVNMDSLRDALMKM